MKTTCAPFAALSSRGRLGGHAAVGQGGRKIEGDGDDPHGKPSGRASGGERW